MFLNAFDVPQKLKYEFMYKVDDLDTVGMNKPLLAIKSAIAINEIESTLEIDPNQRKATTERWKQILTN